MRFLLKSFFIVVFACSNAMATDYFVDYTSGSDSNSGLSYSDAWKTVSKVNSFTFEIGDDVYFKCGETWVEEALTVDWAGFAGDHVVIGSYYGSGTIGVSGDRPHFDGNYNVLNPTLACTGGTNAGLIDTAQDYVDIKNISIEDSSGSGIRQYNNQGGSVDNCVILDTFKGGIFFYNVDDYEITNNVVGRGAQMRFSCTNGPATIQNASSSSGCLISGNTVYEGAMEGIGLYKGVSGCTVEYNKVYDIRSVAIYIDHADNSVVRYNQIWLTSSPADSEYYWVGVGVQMEDGTAGFPEPSDNYIYGNVIANERYGFWIGNQDPDNGDPGNNHIFNNAIIDPKTAVIIGNMDYTGSTFRNNIQYSPSGSTTVFASLSSLPGGWTFDHNAWELSGFWFQTGDVIVDANFDTPSGWTALTQSGFDVEDISLTAGSICIDAGSSSVSVSNMLDPSSTNLFSATLLDNASYGSGYEMGPSVFSDVPAGPPDETDWPLPSNPVSGILDGIRLQ